MTQYRVTLKEITVEADNERHAAQMAYHAMRIVGTPNIFVVRDPASISTDVTLTFAEADKAADIDCKVEQVKVERPPAPFNLRT